MKVSIIRIILNIALMVALYFEFQSIPLTIFCILVTVSLELISKAIQIHIRTTESSLNNAFSLISQLEDKLPVRRRKK